MSYQLSKRGLKVVQVGCDPKHDSTRLLLGGKSQTTVLEYMGSGNGEPGDTVAVGKNGVVCIEAGGPEPGVGCAGRGILTAFNFIESNGLVGADTDVMIYDVLGDVVCGGFAVPLRKKYADAVFIVTSGEFMSLYAANNVLRGIRNFDGDGCRVAGLVLNRRGNEGEVEYVENFADAVGLPIISVIPRSNDFSVSESEGKTISERFPDSEGSAAMGRIASVIEGLREGDGALYPADPLDDGDLDKVAKGIRVVRDRRRDADVRILAVSERETLRSCGAAMAALCCTEIEDADVVVHGPLSCHYLFSGGYDSAMISEDRAHRVKSIGERMFCTDLTDRSSIFGGRKELEAVLRSRATAGSRLIFAVTTCVPGIIGDDVEGICTSVSDETGVRIIPVLADGILNGGVIQGHDIALSAITSLVDMNVRPEPDAVNIIGYECNPDRTMMAVDDTDRLVKGLGLRINCLFLHENTVEDMANLRRGAVDLMYSGAVGNRRALRFLEERVGIPGYPEPLPAGISNTLRWIEDFGRSIGVPENRRRQLAETFSGEAEKFRSIYGGRLKGMRCILYFNTWSEIDWVIEILGILGVDIASICCPTENKWNLVEERMVERAGAPVIYDVDFDDFKKIIESEKPDMALGNNLMMSQISIPHYSLRRPRTGIRSVFEYAKRIVRMMEVSGL